MIYGAWGYWSATIWWFFTPVVYVRAQIGNYDPRYVYHVYRVWGHRSAVSKWRGGRQWPKDACQCERSSEGLHRRGRCTIYPEVTTLPITFVYTGTAASWPMLCLYTPLQVPRITLDSTPADEALWINYCSPYFPGENRNRKPFFFMMDIQTLRY